MPGTDVRSVREGAAIAWAIAELRKDGVEFEVLLIVDADTIADPGALDAFNDGLLAGHQIQQGYCYISNPWDSPFTRIIAVTSILRNQFFYGGKAVAGLSGMLVGTGMCFSHDVVSRYGWTALSVAEDAGSRFLCSWPANRFTSIGGRESFS